MRYNRTCDPQNAAIVRSDACKFDPRYNKINDSYYSPPCVASKSRVLLQNQTIQQTVKYSSYITKQNLYQYAQKLPPLFPIPIQMSPAHSLLSYLFKFHFNIILPYIVNSFHSSIHITFPYQNFSCIFPSTCSTHFPPLSLFILIFCFLFYELACIIGK